MLPTLTRHPSHAARRARRAASLLLLALALVRPAVPQTPDPDSPRGKGVEPITWENLEERLARAAEAGFSGSVLVVRDGKTFLDRAYGFADRDKRIPNRTDTIYAIGSTPIDFTRAGILLLAQRGKVDLGDRITKYLDGVPRDKRGITLEHLMEGRSGLRDFHGRPSDPNPDHFFIDRDEAMRRIFEGELLFAPGEGRRHSHSAWGVLAAVIEIVSGTTYPEFTRRHLFGPAGMEDTGFFGEPYDADRMALGYGGETSGTVNAPPYWGPPSWLVMGSGGQVSTTGDLRRWHRALADGKILDPEHLRLYWASPGSVLAGGDMFGFEIVYTQGPDTMMVLISNAGGPSGMPAIQALGNGLALLVNAASRPPYSLGIQMEVTEPGGIRVERVVEGSAAGRDGLRAGDRLLTADGRALAPEPLAVLDPLLRTGEPIRFTIERDGRRLDVTVTPDPR